LRASITSERELVWYVGRVTAFCVVIALAVDVVNQLSFFVDWATCLRSWAITTVLVLALAIPIARIIGKAHLELYRAKLLAEELGRTDQLTGLPNRRAFMEAVHEKDAGALALVIVDIDRFKRVNDTHGHLAGDAVICAVGDMMVEELGPFGVVARIGGEEFALVSSVASTEALAAKLATFRDRVKSAPIPIKGSIVRVTVSAGVAARDAETLGFDQLFSQADQALYAAKLSGRNRIAFASSLEGLARQRDSEPEEPGDKDSLLRSA
jgi:diguanylate cyclase (GGDEF)-like protein